MRQFTKSCASFFTVRRRRGVNSYTSNSYLRLYYRVLRESPITPYADDASEYSARYPIWRTGPLRSNVECPFVRCPSLWKQTCACRLRLTLLGWFKSESRFPFSVPPCTSRPQVSQNYFSFF